MGRRAELDRFVHAALSAGRDRADIASALRAAGWPGRDIDRALGAYHRSDFLPPVPRPQPFVSGRDAFLYGLTFVALVVVVVNAVSLAFEAIEWALRDTGRLRAEWRIAALAVFAPVFVALDRRARGSDRDSPMRKICAYAALFCASIVILADLVAVLALLLGGGLGAEVALKALAVGIAAAAVGFYYRADLAEDAPAQTEEEA
ncbi:hypothetical protein SAMN04488012_102483 [Palleronia salina]|uniref:DUF5671 domain-containing protein n=1 Tax=Palleronia salina TaxID=313368 RepID=A0A1M6DQQ9_9RHOB|nr:DUF5671 domain-containing protein [Palleronia salina]SHI75513.1 hypothetical protein SAMN04488012_102483 [Palleronia salina]